MNKNRERLLNLKRDFSDYYFEMESYNQIIEESPNPVIIHDQIGNIIYENNKSTIQAGGSLMGKCIKDFVHPAYHNALAIRTQKVLSGGKIDFKEVILSDCNGNFFDAEVSGIRIKVKDNDHDHDKFVIMVAYHDITERKAVKKALIEAEVRYRILMEDALVGEYIYQDNEFVYVNPLLQEMLGYTLKELNEKGLLNIIISEDRELIQNNLTKAYYSQKIVNVEIRVINKNGQI